MPTLKQRLARLSPYLRASRIGLVGAALGSALGALTEPAIPALMKPLLDRGFTGGTLPLWLIPLAIIGLFAIRGAAGFVAQYGLAWTANRAVLQLRSEMFERLITAAPGLYSRHSASTLTNMVVYEVQGGTGLLVGSILTLVRDTLTMLALLAYLLWLNWQLTLFVALLFPAVAYAMRSIGNRLHRISIDSQSATDGLAYVVEENVLAWRIVRLHGAARAQTARFLARSDLLRRLALKSVVASASMTPITQVLAACALSSVIAIALWQSGRTGATVGGFVSFITALLMLVAPIKHLSDVMAPITRGLVAVERGLDLIEHSPREVGGAHDGGRARGVIEFEQVSLAYREDAPPALAGIDLRVQAGETVALVGPSGAGKTTLVNLLPRFLEPSSGAIRLDGVALADWRIEALRRQFALVSQDVVLFNDTIAANVTLGATMAPEAVREALRGANLLAFVETLPQGMDTVIGHNGSQLSGGQRQRLAIARAIAKDAPVLILDEATSALDSESERAVQEALERLMVGRTSIVIAHRLSTIEHADRVLVLDGGRLIEQGTHAELLGRGGLYARLHALQFRS
ncbi:MAG: lipid A export permease/ATP-binding protein MsbA [Burkholderiales bacterium]|nr:lipid A export permease/ATP-binding protein MsbA [Burkholderiales bacterium]